MGIKRIKVQNRKCRSVAGLALLRGDVDRLLPVDYTAGEGLERPEETRTGRGHGLSMVGNGDNRMEGDDHGDKKLCIFGNTNLGSSHSAVLIEGGLREVHLVVHPAT